MRTAAAPAGVWLTAAGAGLLAGTALQLQQPVLWPVAHYGACVGAALVGVAFGLWRQRRRGEAAASPSAPVALLPALAWLLVFAALSFGATGWRATQRLAHGLPAALEGVDLAVVGVVSGLPQRSPDAWRFQFEVESAHRDGMAMNLPERLSLGWYASERAPLPALRAGQRWQLAVRLRRPHGVQNPHGFDYELMLFEQGVLATGYVRALPAARNQLLESAAGHPIDRLRQAVRDAILARVMGGRGAAPAQGDLGAVPDAAGPMPAAVPERRGPGEREAGVLAALAVGDQAAIERDDWALYRQTGVAHLMSISGLHVTMFAWLAALVLHGLWRRSGRLMLACPAPIAARWGGLSAALAYAVFAGWGVPAQRTVLMLAAITLLGAAGLRWRWPLVWGAAMVVVVAIDPWALLQPGFWLSFAAVGLLMASGWALGGGRDGQQPGFADRWIATASGLAVPAHAASRGKQGQDHDVAEPLFEGRGAVPTGAAAALRSWPARMAATLLEGLRTQFIATLGLAPLTLVFFQQLSVVGFVANLVAIPLVTLLITPLALLGMLLPPLWPLAAWLVQGLNAALQALALPQWAVWSVAAAPAWAVPVALLGSALALLPLPWRVRALAVPLLLPLFAPAVPRPAPGAFDLLAVDVGQGTAVLLRTAKHSLLYDAGPQYSRESDAGERVIVPLLRALGERRLDLMVLSHRDTDHVGGAAAVLQAVPVTQLSSSLERAHPLLQLAARQGAEVGPCLAGQRWDWDGVSFEVLHPSAEALAFAEEGKAKPNTLSCVLRVGGLDTGSRPAAGLPAAASASPVVDVAGPSPGTVLLTGDMERLQELVLVSRHGAALSSDVLVVPHHGSKTSSSAALLDAVAPRVAVVQAGYGNRFGHPAAEVVARYAERGIPLIDSPRCGAWRYASNEREHTAEGCWRVTARRYWHHPDIAAPQNGVEVAIPDPDTTDPKVP